jgi:hypothetical protein
MGQYRRPFTVVKVKSNEVACLEPTPVTFPMNAPLLPLTQDTHANAARAQRQRRRVLAGVLWSVGVPAASIASAVSAAAQGNDAASLAKAAQNPIADMISLNLGVEPDHTHQRTGDLAAGAYTPQQAREFGLGDIQSSACLSPEPPVGGWRRRLAVVLGVRRATGHCDRRPARARRLRSGADGRQRRLVLVDLGIRQILKIGAQPANLRAAAHCKVQRPDLPLRAVDSLQTRNDSTKILRPPTGPTGSADHHPRNTTP